ncbi:transposase IS200-family protein [Caldalkalibacillus thermarum TA2.A1]|uniref:IS200/IS605 family transposase n=1 Tax=Caldalkalibacillus thermarum (strain TA2.A1) TaxID=986075 RepID=F5L6F0_CALTT|nr:IS200/IS605 family transposase [Caldalkalibacillus thermarum]EGL83084.1 transposase IS200-family protein [Caldalkalibacillus thermarum TA2.A1]QZT33654.1 IS200/IS605 family transposase [Caldalkalibacillus thermarum TA2.A1]QZT33685.1 IS200/IS605 family transposase [Caldalkalibacillus thermarum TA2.A1]GGK34313.1 IS200/IS605 family transposase [Caldalkalibacillus thermarum]
MQDFKRNRHAVYRLVYHLVVVTKYRHSCITPEMMNRLKEIAIKLFNQWNAEIIEMNGESDHIHILFEAPPQVQLSKLINNFKTVSSRYIRKEFADHLKKHYWKPYFWSRSYMLFTTGGAPLEVIKAYIEQQGKKNG